MPHASSFENVPESHNITDQELTMEEINGIQWKLIEESGEDPYDWIEKYSDAFRALRKSDHSLHELYAKDPETCLTYIKKILENPTHH